MEPAYPGAAGRRIKPSERRLTVPRLGLRDSMKEGPISTRTPEWTRHGRSIALVDPFDRHEVICRSSAVLRCIAAGRSASV